MERLVKGIHILPLQDFINETYDDDTRSAIYKRMAPETREMLKTVSRDEWKPVSFVADINHAVYESQSDPDTGYQQIINAGAAIADYAAGTYVRLLIKLMTPKIMASKWPDIWKKSHNFGDMRCRLEADRLLKMTLADVDGYTHIGPTAIGFLTFSLNAMGLPDARVKQLNRSESPNSSRYEFEIVW